MTDAEAAQRAAEPEAPATVWDQSQEAMRGRVVALEETALAVLEGHVTDEARRRGEEEARKLSGSLGTFGLSDAARLASHVEWLLRGSRPLGQADSLRLSELVVALRSAIASGPAAGARDQAEGTGPTVLVVDADRDLGHRLVEEATARGLRPIAVASVTEAWDRIAAGRPDLVVLDPDDPVDPDGGRHLLEELCRAVDPVPTLVLTAPGGKVDRAETARVGGAGFLEKPTQPTTVVEVVRHTLDRHRPGSTVLVVDPDPAVPTMLQTALQPHGLRVEALDDPSRFWPALELIRPDLLVVDVERSGIDGMQLCRMVRNDHSWERLPVVFLTGGPVDGDARHADHKRDMYRAGADDVLVKPIGEAELAERITNRLERSRLQRRQSDAVDPRTGLATWPRFEAELQRMLSIARRYGQAVAVAVLAVDGRRDLDRRFGSRAGQAARAGLARMLQRAFRFEDIVGVRGDDQLVAALYGAEPAGAVDRLASVLESYRSEQIALEGAWFQATVSSGLAMYPADGTRVGALVGAAADALGRASDEGGDRVKTANAATPIREGTVDVLVVDEDDALSAVLLHALATRGYRTHRLTDGGEAVSLLVNPEGLRARVVLLEVDLPGLDGLSALRELARQHAIDNTRVIMVTLRSGEQEVLQALELGAFDHVAKPVSVPLLLHRIRQALASLAP